MMDSFDREFLMEMFLDNDSVSAVNRLAIAVADVVSENVENVSNFNNRIKSEYDKCFPLDEKDILALSKKPKFAICPCKTKKIQKGQSVCLVNTEDATPMEVDSYSQIDVPSGAQVSCDPETISTLNKKEYAQKFQMKWITLQALINFLRDFVQPSAHIVDLETKVFVFLWCLTSKSSFRDVGLRYNLNKSTVSYIFHEMATYLMELKYHFITWPSIEEQHQTRSKVSRLHKFPNCVGFIDACSIEFGSKGSKKRDMFLLQAVCDENLMFIDIHIGTVGENSKANVYKSSTLSEELTNFIEFENHILGDSDYELQINLLTPFESKCKIEEKEEKFNKSHMESRRYVHQAFELLKKRYKKLSCLYINKPESATTVISAACVLHNFVLLHEGIPGVKQERFEPIELPIIENDFLKTAIAKREHICEYICEHL